ncbi:MAG: hypothetical protein IT186_08440 [Acidobacteria bacterium]|nr:hypothetical protein [Acidobacteriota bacterium]
MIIWRHPALVLLLTAVCLGAAGAPDGSGAAAALADAAGASRPDMSAHVTDAQFAYAQKTLLKVRGRSKLFLLTPPGGRNKDTLLMLELSEDTPYGNGYRHGQLLAGSIADVVTSRYSCFGQDVLDWMRSAYDRMPSGFRDEIRGIADGMAQEGYRFPLPLVALHATQPLVPLAQTFPWFVCPREGPAGAGPTGSFSHAIWGRYTPAGTGLAINSPDWGAVPMPLARNRVLVSVWRGYPIRHAYLGVAGVVGMPGVNETGLSIAGTAGVPSISARTPMPGNGVPVPNGFMTPFMMAAHALRTMNGNDGGVFNRFENEVLRINPVDVLILQMSTRTRSVLWESGASASPGYPSNSRREAGAWDSGDVEPVDWRGDFGLLFGNLYRLSTLPFPVWIDFRDSLGEAHSGRARPAPGGTEIRWQRRRLGRMFSLPADPGRGERFAKWHAGLGARPVSVPFVIGEGGNGGDPSIVFVSADKRGGWWVLADGSGYGSWAREGESAFRAFDASGGAVCSGPLYDFGNGVTGWCSLDASTDVEWIAWTHRYPDGAGNRLDGMNLSVIPDVKPWAAQDKPGFGSPHSRTHFVMRELGAPSGNLSLDGLFRVLQRAYFSAGTENEPFGTGAYDLATGDALFTLETAVGGSGGGGSGPDRG